MANYHTKHLLMCLHAILCGDLKQHSEDITSTPNMQRNIAVQTHSINCLFKPRWGCIW